MSQKSKTIKINPELFGIKKSRTKTIKNRNRGSKPLVNSHILKKEFLNKIKAHRAKINNIDVVSKYDKVNGIANTMQGGDNDNRNGYDNKDDDNDNELINSIQYLSELSNNQKIIKKGSGQQQKTFKRANSSNNSLNISLTLPKSLETNPLVPVHTNVYSSTQSQPVYSCLKGGTRPTFRELQRTQRNTNEQNNPTSKVSLTSINPNILNNDSTTRERKLDLLRNKVKREQSEKSLKISTFPITTVITPNVLPSQQVALPQQTIDYLHNSSSSEVSPHIDPLRENNKKVMKKKITKKTIRRKYTLGKSKIRRKMSVLLKDNRTRRRVMDAQKEIKKVSMTEVKMYLKKHGLLKVGTRSPNNVLRQMYETVMLTGEIYNKNPDLLLHNFMSDTDDK